MHRRTLKSTKEFSLVLFLCTTFKKERSLILKIILDLTKVLCGHTDIIESNGGNYELKVPSSSRPPSSRRSE